MSCKWTGAIVDRSMLIFRTLSNSPRNDKIADCKKVEATGTTFYRVAFNASNDPLSFRSGKATCLDGAAFRPQSLTALTLPDLVGETYAHSVIYVEKNETMQLEERVMQISVTVITFVAVFGVCVVGVSPLVTAGDAGRDVIREGGQPAWHAARKLGCCDDNNGIWTGPDGAVLGVGAHPDG
jgi:hypothetical protein